MRERDGAVNTARFRVYLEQGLGPTLRPGDVVVLDNLPVPKAPERVEVVGARGARRLFLPPYSPAFTPIELAFSKLKTSWRAAAARTRHALTEAVRAARDWGTAQDAQGWFAHCGYHVQ